jgi:hypothetical protein
VTVNVYELPTVREITIGLDPPDAVPPPDEVIVNEDIAAPPVAPAVNGTEIFAAPVYACPVAQVAVPTVGACGTVVAVMLLDAADAALVPIALVAVTVNV